MTDITEKKILKVDEKQKVTYCIPLFLRDEQVKQSIARIKGRIEPYPIGHTRSDRIAIVCFGPSLNDTWEEVRSFKYIVSCSGSHKFLVDRGITPTWHVEVDPRAHKVQLIGQPQKETEYLIASCCHPKVFDLLEGYNVKLWHSFDPAEDYKRLLPPGEWALTGGCSVGLRAMAIARFFGFTNQHVFGMDGSEGKTGKHADVHPNQAKGSSDVEYPEGSGIIYKTTPGFLEAARGTFHELNQMPDVHAHFYGEGLVQAMAKDYVRKPPTQPDMVILGEAKPELISAEYVELNARLHKENLAYGVGGGKHAKVVMELVKINGIESVLDYGCGKSYLQKSLPFPIWEYDPAFPEKSKSPRPADLVCCLDVLEHVEYDKLKYVLDDLRRCVLKVGYFVIHTGPAQKTFANGENTHLIQKNEAWWKTKIEVFFDIGKVWNKDPEIHMLVGPKTIKQ